MNGSRELPTGTVSFVFTDIEGSTRLLEALGGRYRALLDAHAEIIRDAVEDHGGVEVNTEGDSFFLVFPRAGDAIRCAAAFQRALAQHHWPQDATLRVRCGVHTGVGTLGGDDYAGIDVNRAARIAAAGHGGQIVLSDSTRTLVQGDLPPASRLRDLHTHRLKDLGRPEHLWQLDLDDLRTDFPELRTVDARPNNLPLAASALIGREDDVPAIAELLAQSRLVTLTGPGGSGKSRLARTVARRMLAKEREGVWFIGLEESKDRCDVAAAIAAVVGSREAPGTDQETALFDTLRSSGAILILDNFEQARSAGPLVAEILAASPHLRVLVTSRAPLRVSGEQEFPVAPLATPDPDHISDIDRLADVASVALFVDRARSVRPGFRLDPDNAAAVAGICALLDGLPLAIELAAQRIRMLSPDAILRRLQGSLALLGDGPRDRPERQQTLRGAIAWSYELLGEPERRLFERLAVFQGGWTFDSAERVLRPTSDTGLGLFEGLAALIDESLVKAASDTGDEPRFDMLGVIRSYALDRLEEGSTDVTRADHAAWIAALTDEAAPQLVRGSLPAWQLRLRAERDNIRAALRWASSQDPPTALRIAGASWRYWHYWAEIAEGRSWLESTIAAAPEAPVEIRARALRGLAALRYWQGDVTAATELYDRTLSLRRELDDPRPLARALLDRCWVELSTPPHRIASDLATEALVQQQAARSPSGEATMRALLAASDLYGDAVSGEEAAEAARAAATVTAERGDAVASAEMRALEAHVLRLTDLAQDAYVAAQQALCEFDELGHLGRIGGILDVIAALEAKLDRPERAIVISTARDHLASALGGGFGGLIDPGPLTMAEGDLPLALAEAAMARGRAMTRDEAVDYALAESK